jgi:threonine dehydrogenase-like Zn-dependent dehydrogenase
VSRPPLGAARPHDTEHAIQFVGPGQLVHNRAKPVPQPGPTQLLVQVEAVGICFSDTKLLHAFSGHPRKNVVLGGIDPGVLAEIPSYVPGEAPTVPGHEVACRIVAVGTDVRRHRVGERCLVQTDYRHLPTVQANAAFGYNFEGGLQEYVLLDERMILEPGTGERFLIPVAEGPGSSAVALLEPWACVESSYAYRERRELRSDGRLLVVADGGHEIDGLAGLVSRSRPAALTGVAATGGQRSALAALDIPDLSTASIDGLPRESFDDVVYFGADPATIERLQEALAPRGMLNVVTGGRRIGRPVAVDVGRVHYDLVRWVGTTATDAADAYRSVPDSGELLPGDRVLVVGAAGPMGLMHVVRAASGGVAGVTIVGADIDDARLAHLAHTVEPIAAAHGVPLQLVNSRETPLEPGFTYAAVLVPAPFLVTQAVDLAGERCRINLFAGFAVHTRSDIDLDRYIDTRCYLLGTSGSVIDDMRAVLAKLERGDLDTNISVDAVCGMEGVADALDAVEARTSGGKIVVYPSLHDMGLVRLSELPERFPAAAALLADGTWTKAAEDALLRDAASEATGAATGGGATAQP